MKHVDDYDLLSQREMEKVSHRTRVRTDFPGVYRGRPNWERVCARLSWSLMDADFRSALGLRVLRVQRESRTPARLGKLVVQRKSGDETEDVCCRSVQGQALLRSNRQIVRWCAS